MRWKVLFFFITCSMIPISVAQGSELPTASFLPGGNYPPPQCRAPLRPLPGDRALDWRLYRNAMASYRQCVTLYLETARQDIERIRKKMDRAVRKYNEESGNSF